MKTIKKTRKELDEEELKRKKLDKKRVLNIRKKRIQKDNERNSKDPPI
jgi:hypothetical protein